MSRLLKHLGSREAITRTQAILIAAVLVVAAVGGAYYLTSVGPPAEEKVLLHTQLGALWQRDPGRGLDPQHVWVTDASGSWLMYETLFMWDPNELKEGRFRLVPWLAEGYTLSPDGLEYTIKLRKGIKFHFTGKEMKAEDVQYSIHRVHSFDDYPPEIQAKIEPKLTSFKDARVVDDYTIVLTLKNKDPSTIEYLAFVSSGYPVMEKAVVESHAITTEDGKNDHGVQYLNFDGGDAGTGPYYLASPEDHVPTERLVVTRFDGWWGGPPELNLPKPKFSQVYILPISEDADARMRLERGDLDVYQDCTVETYFSLSQTPGIGTFSGPGAKTFDLWFHVAQPPFKDWKVRKAVKAAVDYTTIAEDILHGTALVGQGAFSPGQEGYDPKQYYSDAQIDLANSLLDEAGYPRGADGNRFSTDLLIYNTPRYGVEFDPLALSIASDLAKVGIKVNIVKLSPGEFWGVVTDPTCPPLIFISPGPTYVLDEPGWEWQWHLGEGGTYYTGWNATNQGDLVTKWERDYYAILEETDRNKRIEMWKELDQFMLEYGPGVTLIHVNSKAAFREEVTGYFSHNATPWPAIFFMDKED
jgi:ABC-type transport system substrate-binding protein